MAGSSLSKGTGSRPPVRRYIAGGRGRNGVECRDLRGRRRLRRTAMWQSRLFGSLPMLLEFVNEHRLTHDRFKLAIVPPRLWQRRSGPRYYLIYWTDESPAELA